MVYRWRVLGRALKLAFTKRYCRPRFLLWLMVIFSLKYSVVLLVRLLQAADYLFFPGFRRQTIQAPVYILANPRSGTTYLHRILAADSQFTFQRLYQTVFPSILWYKLFALWGVIDRRMGRLAERFLLAPINRLFFGQWDGVHVVGFHQSEEDEAMWIFPWLTPSMLVFFPFIEQLRDQYYVDQLPRREQLRINRYLQRTLQRHLYVMGPNKTLLGKNAVAAHRIQRYLEVMPDMRIIHLYRHPYESIASALSMFSKKMWEIHSPQCAGASPEVKAAAELWCEHYLLQMNLRDHLPPERYIEFAYTEVAADPKGAVEKIYARFGLAISPEYRQVLEAEAARAGKFESQHDYDLAEFGISREWIYERLKPAFERYGFAR